MVVNGFTHLGEAEIGRHELSFQGVDLRGNIIPGSVLWTTELGLIPAGPLTIAPFEEATQFDDVPSYHGQLENALYAEAHTYSNSTGSWDFYFTHDGKNRSPWDQCAASGCVGGEAIATEYGQGVYHLEYSQKALENYPGWYVRAWTFSGEMRKLMSMLQGRRVQVTMPDEKTYRGRCWVSKFDTDDSGRMTVTISYDLVPPANYPNETSFR